MMPDHETREEIRIRFSGPPGPWVGCLFMEVENAKGESINFGEWVKDTESEDWFLRFYVYPVDE